ncbi:MFS transporter [Streptomyces sp. TRM66268-LWL]|uniref:MFS transporter n=1 Tax=Streptomyces polyasparticus TaxID=2767826 RepID=A0ABR7SGE4_9ACTN|nr:bifunctional serine/threonine protein kinase/MFS transporter [Streptomyces polyasparticus]MBC9714560.1 MFS transporter [Streptomyces polyasparticus]
MDQLITEDPTHIGPYRLIARLGAGGMGLVYLGRSEAGRTVAVKVVQAEHAAHQEFRRRFAREVAAARRVGGAWTAAVLDADTDAQVPWVATQYIPGPDLTSVVAKDFGPLPEASVRVLAHRLAEALTAVHAAGLIHRDLKPSNVLVTVDGPRVIDFGIARAMDSLTADSLLTHTGMLIGSPGFMSPEQVRGLELTPASDVFCLGAVLVYAATGRMLFGAGTTGLNAHLFRIAEEEPDLAGVPDSLLPLVRECLAKDPSQRPTPAQIMERTAVMGADEWLPGAVLAQLGRHAAQLLDFAPETRAPGWPGSTGAPGGPATPGPQAGPTTPGPQGSPGIPQHDADAGPLPPPPGYTPTAHAGSAPQGFGAPPQGYGPPFPVPPAPLTPAAVPGAHPRRWAALVVAALAQLLVLLDIALTSATYTELYADVGLSGDAGRWMFFAYTLTSASLLLPAGHIADLVGRKPLLISGLSALAGASALTATAPGAGMLIGAHALLGTGAALVSSAALGLVSAHFTAPGERARAFGVYAMVVAGGGALGWLAAGSIQELFTWRLTRYAFAALALVLLIVAAKAVYDLPLRRGARFDLPGVLLGTLAMSVFALAFDQVSVGGWTAVPLGGIALGGVLLLAFLWTQTRSASALLPSYALRDPSRKGALLTLLLASGAAASLLPSAATYLREVQGSSPLQTGVFLLPLVGAAALGGLLVAPRLQVRVAPSGLIVPGLLLAALGLFLLGNFTPSGSYGVGILPSLVLSGLGLGLALAPLFTAATGGLGPQDTAGGAAVALTARDLGLGLGIALVSGFLADGISFGRDQFAQYLTDSYGKALHISAGVMVLGALTGLLVTARSDAAEPVRSRS